MNLPQKIPTNTHLLTPNNVVRQSGRPQTRLNPNTHSETTVFQNPRTKTRELFLFKSCLANESSSKTHQFF